jgi:hypothetical protein
MDDVYTGPYGNANQNTCQHATVVSQRQVTFLMRQRGEKSEYKCTACSKVFVENPPNGSQVKCGFVAYCD